MTQNKDLILTFIA